MSFVKRAEFSNVDPILSVWDNIVHEDGSLFIVHDIVGWYGGSGVRSEDKSRIGGGEFLSRRDRTARNLTARVSIETTSLDLKYFIKRVFSGMFHDPEGDYGLKCLTRDGLELETTVRPDGEFIPMDMGLTGVTASIPLKAGDPQLYGPWRTSTLRPVGTGIGLDFPLFSRQSPVGSNLVTNGGFELGGIGWQSTQADRAEIVEVPDAYEGSHVMRITPHTLNTYPYTDAVSTVTDRRYRISYMVRHDGQDPSGRIRQYNLVTKADGSTQGLFHSDIHTADEFPANTWGKVTFDLTVAVEDAASIQFAPHFGISANTYEIDDFQVTETTGIITFGESIASDDLIWNDGNTESWPYFEVVGDFPGGVGIDMNGHRATYPWPILPDMPVIFDSTGALLVSGMDQSHLLGERDWAPIPAHSIVKASMFPLRGGTGWATAHHRDTYL